jgi:hypothetical protein
MHNLRRTGAIALATVGACAASAAVVAAASSPSVSTGAHRQVRQTSAVLLGTVTPNGSPTGYLFEWGLTTGYGATSHPRPAGRGTRPVSVSALATGLIPGTVYHYRIVAVSRYGQSDGRDHTFRTAGAPPPAVATGPAIQPGQTGVTLTGIVNPNGAATGWRFQYGLSSAYTTYTTGGTVAAGRAPVVVTERLSGLAPGTFFHYRLVAFHGSVASGEGSDEVFLTEPSPRPRPRLTMRTKPRRAGRAPFTFTTTGRVIGPAYIPSADACTGYVAVRFFLARRDVSFVLAPLAANCTYSAQTSFRRLPGPGRRGRVVVLHIAVRFRGNGYLGSVGRRHGRVILR